MDPHDVAKACASGITNLEDFLSSGQVGNRMTYPMAVVETVATYLGGTIRENVLGVRKDFINHMRENYFADWFESGESLDGVLQEGNWSGQLVLPTFSFAGRAYLEDRGLDVSEDQFVADFARFSLRMDEEKLLSALHLFGADGVFYLMAGGNKNYTTLTQIGAQYMFRDRFKFWNWFGERAETKNKVRVNLTRTSTDEYKAALGSVLDQAGVNSVLASDCLQTRVMYDVILGDYCGIGDGLIEEFACETSGDNHCVYRITMKPQLSVASIAMKLLRSKFNWLPGAEEQRRLLQRDTDFARMTADYRKMNMILVGQKAELARRNVALVRGLKQRTTQLEELRALRSAAADDVEIVHRVKGALEGAQSIVYTFQTRALLPLARKYPALGLEPDEVQSLGFFAGARKFAALDIGFVEKESPDDAQLLSEIVNFCKNVVSSFEKSAVTLGGVVGASKVRRKVDLVPYRRLWDAALEDFGFSHGDTRVKFVGDIPNVFVNGIADELQTVLVNILNNGAEHQGPGQEIEVGFSLEDRVIATTITNAGDMVPEAVIQGLNDGVHFSSKDLGTGSGTQLTFRVAKDVKYEARPEGGLSLTFTLPIKK